MKKFFFLQKLINIKYFELFLLIIDFILVFVYSKFESRYLFNYYSEIRLIIQGNGTQNIINEKFAIEPSQIIISGRTLGNSCTKKSCDLKNELNNITFRFNQTIKSFENIFKNMINIKEIDLSDFDFSTIENMYSMFYNCSNLEKINFGNINTSAVQNMSYLFSYCYKLQSIDLSKFDTSSVINMERMFYRCSSLQSLNVSNFKTTKVISMESMFYGCILLESIDISYFDTSKVTSMAYMFYK